MQNTKKKAKILKMCSDFRSFVELEISSNEIDDEINFLRKCFDTWLNENDLFEYELDQENL